MISDYDLIEYGKKIGGKKIIIPKNTKLYNVSDSPNNYTNNIFFNSLDDAKTKGKYILEVKTIKALKSSKFTSKFNEIKNHKYLGLISSKINV